MCRSKLCNFLIAIVFLLYVLTPQISVFASEGTSINIGVDGANVIATNDGKGNFTITGDRGAMMDRDKFIKIVRYNANDITIADPIALPVDSSYLFCGYEGYTSYKGNLYLNPDIDTSKVVNMECMFYYAKNVNPDVSKWDVSNVTNMGGMFYCTEKANPDVSKWDVSNVIKMNDMFYGALEADPDVSKWDVSNVKDMCSMFNFAEKANPDVSKWDVSNVTNMGGMFSATKEANPDVSKWDVSNVTDMREMFDYSEKANPDVSKWDVSNVQDMTNMFSTTKVANPDVSKWNVSNVTNMNCMFYSAEKANPDVSKWDVSNVTDMMAMFLSAKVAEPDVSNWNVSNVTEMTEMFNNAKSIKNIDLSNFKNIERDEKFFPLISKNRSVILKGELAKDKNAVKQDGRGPIELFEITDKAAYKANHDKGKIFIKKFKDLNKIRNELEDNKLYLFTTTSSTPKFSVTIDGNVIGEYEENETVSITTEIPQDKKFVNWTSADGVVFGDATNPATTFKMPAHNVVITSNIIEKPNNEKREPNKPKENVGDTANIIEERYDVNKVVEAPNIEKIPSDVVITEGGKMIKFNFLLSTKA